MNDETNENMGVKSEDMLSEATSDFEFLQEKIKERPINKKKLLRRMIITASMAVLFGLLACLSFLLLEPVLSNWLYPEEEPEIVTFPQEKNEMLPEDMLTEGTTTEQEEENDSQPDSSSDEGIDDTTLESSSSALQGSEESASNESESEQSSVENTEEKSSSQESTTNEEELEDEDKDETILDKESPDEKDQETETVPIEPLKPYQMQYEELYKVYNEIESSMVTVTAVHSEVDWFNNTYQSEGTTAGVIIANNNRELLILSRKSSLDGAEIIRISFCNGTDADAVIKQYDQNTDLAVLAVDLKYVGSDTLDSVSVATLGSSVSADITGKPVIAIGNLFGYKDTVCYGIITSKGNVITMADSEYKLMTTDIYAGTNPSGILVNMDREVIGIIDNRYNHEDTKNLLSAIGITELKELIAKLSNGEDIPYLGIHVQDISVQTREDLGLPQGVFIVDIDMDSPALLNGIQKGDILVQIGGQEIKSVADYMNVIRNVSIENGIGIVVQRASIDAYEEMFFVVQPE